MAPSLEGWPAKAKEAPSSHEVRLVPLDTNPVFSEPWDTQNLSQMQNPVKHLQWSIVQKLLTAIVVFANYNYFCNISFSHSIF